LEPLLRRKKTGFFFFFFFFFCPLHFFCFSFVLGRNSIVYIKYILGFVEDCSFFQQQEEEEEEEEEEELLCMW
jgi:hypothetical protein